MTVEQMRAYDRALCPTALLLPYGTWLSLKWYEWGKLNPARTIRGAKENAEFDRWLEELVPSLNAINCECHAKLVSLRYNR